MHWLTKILVVFAAVLSILLAALAVAYSANAGRIVADFQNERLSKEALRASLEEERTAQNAAVASLEARISGVDQQLRESRSEKESLLRDNGRLLADAKTAEAGAISIQARIDQLAATSQTQASLIETMYNEVAKLRENELLYAQREIQLTDRLNDLSGQLEVSTEANRTLQERLADLQRLADTGGSRGADGRTTGPSFTGAIQARITNVRKDPSSGRMLAEIDAGSADRITQGMELSITRGDQFIAKLKVESVDLNEASGTVNFLNRNVDVRVGDMVRTSSLR